MYSWCCVILLALISSMGIKVPAIIKLTKAALDKGQCVVIGLQTTGEVRTT